MFSRVNPIGWALFEELTSAQMNQLDLNASRAIDGTFGGTYNLTNPITINGTLTVTNLTYTGGSVTNMTITSTLTGNIINCNEINVAIELEVDGVSKFDGIAYFNTDVYFAGTAATTVHFVSGGTFDFISGTLKVSGAGKARFESDVTFTSDSNVVVDEFGDWEFWNWPVFQGGLRAYGSISFETRPACHDGLTFDASKLISYGTPTSWVIRYPFALGCQVQTLSSVYELAADGYIKQIANGTLDQVVLRTFPQGFWGKTPFEITAAQFNVKANGTSGTPTDPTQFQIHVRDYEWNLLGSIATADDSNPNNTTDHYVPWTGAIYVDPVYYFFYVLFTGYHGGDTLNGSTKWYELKAIRMTIRTSAKGLY